ncbi:MAG: hypothetical protein IK010_07785 [Bacteroidales bacterium]|nr:hypothetical protein [Bacteroidales bacterium]
MKKTFIILVFTAMSAVAAAQIIVAPTVAYTQKTPYERPLGWYIKPGFGFGGPLNANIGLSVGMRHTQQWAYSLHLDFFMTGINHLDDRADFYSSYPSHDWSGSKWIWGDRIKYFALSAEASYTFNAKCHPFISAKLGPSLARFDKPPFVEDEYYVGLMYGVGVGLQIKACDISLMANHLPLAVVDKNDGSTHDFSSFYATLTFAWHIPLKL